MKIAIEAQRIFRQHKHGMDVVALELIRQLQRLDRSNDYILFAANGPDPNCVSETPTFKKQILGGLTYADWEQISLRAAISKHKPDFIHCTANTAPLSSPVPILLTLHDVIFLEKSDFKGSVYQNFGNIYRRMIVPAAIKKSQRIITVSEYERKLIIDRTKVDPEKIHVVTNGVSERFFSFPREQKEAFRKLFQLPDRFILVLGNTASKKNTEGTVQSYLHYCKRSRDPLPLVIVDYDRRHVEKLLRRAKRPDLMKQFIFPGYIPADNMPLLYNCASLFLYLSLRESFGLPILEAMACGVPVITSNTSAMPETAGEAAVLVNPVDAVGSGEKIAALLDNSAEMAALIEKGLARVKKFSWQTSAIRLMDIYARMV